ncbi:MAG: ABC transporter substrate-binding protein [Spirochaetes bacterium]|nr:ABC transporter substrate-binding protein [Spirochaetota bacterium]
MLKRFPALTVFTFVAAILSIAPMFFLSGCKARKTLVVPEQKEVFKGVIDTSNERLRTGKRGGTIIRADIPEIDTFNIVITRSKPVYETMKLVFEPLLSLHPVTGEIQGCIASGYRITNDGFSLVLELNENVRFSDGRLCTAEDVRFSIEEIYMNPDVDSKKTDLLKIRDRLVLVHKIDDFTVRIDLPVPYRPFLYSLTKLEILPSHILSPLIREGGVEAFNRKWGNPRPQNGDDTNNAFSDGTDDVIGTGPYVIEEYIPGELIRLTPNPHFSSRAGSAYLEGMPYIEEVLQLIGIDEETKRLKFQIGEIDFYDVAPGDILSGDMDSLVQNREEGGYALYYAGQTLQSNHFLTFNLNDSVLSEERFRLFSDRRFREAISLLIDREQIIRDVYGGYAFASGSPERDASWFYKQSPALVYDPLKAAAILDELGLTDKDGDGTRELSGKPFFFSLYTNGDNPLRMKMAGIITRQIEKAGIAVDFEPIDYDLVVTKLLDTFEWEAVLIGLEGTVDPNDASWVWESKGPLHLWAPYQESPRTEWERRIDELFALGRTTWEAESAKPFYFEYQDIIEKEKPVIPIVVPAEIFGIRNGFGNVVPRASSYNSLALVPYLYRTKKR